MYCLPCAWQLQLAAGVANAWSNCCASSHAHSCHLQGFEGLTQRIADYQAEREARAAAVRAEEEEKRLKECSFAPDINRGRVQAKVRRAWRSRVRGMCCMRCFGPSDAKRRCMPTVCPPVRPPPLWQGPVVVRGLDRHLELRQLAERQRAAAEARAARVFHANPRAKQGATVPQPFQLRGHALLEVRGQGGWRGWIWWMGSHVTPDACVAPGSSQPLLIFHMRCPTPTPTCRPRPPRSRRRRCRAR